MKNVIFKRIEIENFLSVGDTTVAIDFKKGLNIITGINYDKDDSKNGVGKTTIADALFFCLFGETIRELKKEEIINNINQKRCRVKLELTVVDNDKTDSYVIERKIAPNKLYLEKNGDDATESSMPKTTEQICKIIGANSEVFRNAVIMTVNGTIPFMAQKKVEKRKFCEGLFNLGVFQDMLLECRRRYNEIKNDVSIERAKLEEVNNALKIYQQQKKKKDIYRIERTEKLLGRENENRTELKQLEGTIKEISLDDIKEFESNIKILEKKRDTVQDEFRKCIRTIATKEEQIKSKKSIIKELNQVGDMCDKCKRPFTEDDKKSRNEKITSIKSDIESTTKEIEAVTQKQSELDALKEKCVKAIERQKNNIRDLNTQKEKNKNTKDRIDQLNEWNKQIKVDIEVLEKECEESEALIKTTNNRLSSLQSTVNDMEKKLEVLNSVKYIVSEEGVKSYIIKKLLTILNGKLAYYLNRMDAPCRFKFNEYFGEQIINEKGQECSYHNFSSGEKKRIDLAILFTFMDIRRLQGNIAINLAFYDEILDTSLDNKGIEMFLDILNERVEKYGESCYIISHKSSAIKSATNDVIFLEKKNGFTTIGKLPE